LKVRTRNERRPQDTVDDTEVGQVTSPLLRNLAILFVPSGVGVLEYGNVFADRGLIIVLILVASTLAAMAATALAFVAARTLLAQRPNGQRTVMQLGAIAVDSGSQ